MDTIQHSILIVDDELAIREMMSEIIRSQGWRPVCAADGAEALRLLEQQRLDAVLTDLRMPGMDGFQLFQTIRRLYRDLPVVMMSAYGGIETAVESIKCGAFDYLPKPFSVERIAALLKALQAAGPSPESRRGRDALEEVIVGRCPAMLAVREMIQRAARFDSAVFLQGQGGTGKEFVARAIHRLSARRDEPFVVASFSGREAAATERELLGYGTPGAGDGREFQAGLFEVAGRGTLFVDEIEEVPVSVQPKLLQALEQDEFRPVGSSRSVRLQARLMVATSRDITQALQNGQFRRDLFYQLHVLSVYLPPLRARSDDITLLIDHFMKKLASRGIEPKKISPDALAQLVSYHWPGNVRELENCLERILVTSRSADIQREDLPQEVLRTATPSSQQGESIIGSRLQDYEHAAVLNALRISKGNKRQAARILEVSIATLYKKLKDYNIEV
ncbi:MAG: sigma-54-dependent Fis family transcriptional regulator [Planctomycetes bacterium]|nr:sigma-54-dependent Fis family transcriptional regulator [Planctomycetota bacterium]